ncbi:MAG: sulfotransferase family 2 domain-containing protein [Cyanobium sp.]
MAPRALISRIDSLVICASPKASCRSVADFAWEVSRQQRLRLGTKMQLIVFRNPFRRLISAYLNKYIEHTRYREASLALCPQAQLDTFADFVEELDLHGFRCIDKVHFKPQRARYRWRSFERIFDADDLEPLRLFVNTLFGTHQEMPFRVASNRPAAARDTLAPEAQATTTAEDTPPWLLPRETLRCRMEDGRAPAYAAFYNPSLEAAARRIYRVDFEFLKRSLERGRMEASLFETLTRL